TFKKQRPHWRWNAWDWDYFHTYVLLAPDADTEVFIDQVNEAVSSAGAEVFANRGYQMKYDLQNIQDIHLYSDLSKEFEINGNGNLMIYLKVIAFFILVLAWVNYVNLSTARASLRAREIAIRKVTGSSKRAISTQIFSESFMYNLTALLISIVTLATFSSFLEPFTAYSFHLSFASLWFYLFIILILGTLGSGFYPAMVLSEFEIIGILKGKFTTSSKGFLLRKTLITFQFITAIILLIGTLSVYKQVNFLRQRDLGLSIEETLVAHMPNLRDERFWPDYDRFKETVSKNPRISMVTTSNEVPGNYTERVEFFKRKGQSRSEAKILNNIWIDYDYFELYELEILAGREFNLERSQDTRWGVMLNQEASKILGFSTPEEAIDQPVDWIHSWGESEPYHIIGVVNDYNQSALSTPIPMVFIMNRPQEPWFEVNLISIKLKTQDINQTTAFIKEEFEKVYTYDAFDSFFLEDHFNQQYESDKRFGKIFGSFSVIAILIAMLGLFGLTSFILLQKKKEIGVRRVLGAQVKNITLLISKEFFTQIGVSVALSIPIMYYLLNKWLEHFPNKMAISLDLFLVPILVLSMIVLSVVVYQSIRATRVNPTESLRD
ncbi:MAG: FtsX-like permease family protein, partial [Bacteroidota bacterium]